MRFRGGTTPGRTCLLYTSLETVEDLKRRGFIDPAMRNWTFEHDNGRNPQTATARFYVESWETMQAENIGYLFWGCLLYTSDVYKRQAHG